MIQKRIRLLSLVMPVLAMVLAPSLRAAAPAAGSVEKKKILSIGAGEQIVYSESCILLDTTPDKWRVVTSIAKGSKQVFYLYAGGRKQGPFETLSAEMIPDCGRETNPCAAYEPAETAFDMDSYIGEEGGNTVIRFSGKKFGPYSQIMQFQLSLDRKRFYAVAADAGQKIWFVSSEGLKTEIAGIPDSLYVSPSGGLALVKVVGNVNPLSDPQKIMANMDAMNKVTLFASDGKKCGPFGSDALSSQGIWFTKSGAHWLLMVGDQLYVDGAPFRKFSESISMCELWLSDDGKTWAKATYEKLEFSDGNSFPYAFNIALTKEAGQSYLTWVSLENNTDIVFYRKAF